MAERRMFANSIIDSDAFLDMPQSSQHNSLDRRGGRRHTYADSEKIYYRV